MTPNMHSQRYVRLEVPFVCSSLSSFQASYFLNLCRGCFDNNSVIQIQFAKVSIAVLAGCVGITLIIHEHSFSEQVIIRIADNDLRDAITQKSAVGVSVNDSLI